MIIIIIMIMVTCTLPRQEEREQSGRSPMAKSPLAPGSPDDHHDQNEDDHQYEDDHQCKDEDENKKDLPAFCTTPWLRAPTSPDSILMMQFVKRNAF